MRKPLWGHLKLECLNPFQAVDCRTCGRKPTLPVYEHSKFHSVPKCFIITLLAAVAVVKPLPFSVARLRNVRWQNQSLHVTWCIAGVSFVLFCFLSKSTKCNTIQKCENKPLTLTGFKYVKTRERTHSKAYTSLSSTGALRPWEESIPQCLSWIPLSDGHILASPEGRSIHWGIALIRLACGHVWGRLFWLLIDVYVGGPLPL